MQTHCPSNEMLSSSLVRLKKSTNPFRSSERLRGCFSNRSSKYPFLMAPSQLSPKRKPAVVLHHESNKGTPKPLQIAKRLEKFKTTIFTQMSSLANKHVAINLGQGFPNFDGPEFVKQAAIQAINEGKNQNARGFGVPEFNAAVAAL
ncbi:hypothetical protein SAY87_019616 [Trapa incisa]|uniref:Aspartate aminotransferase n=1 Tax=Trapa incisa TaxID=236973 RepID=A0AAN7Q7L2_9MYRT|nr:hypothetical protein SAY87_019616 [Trapa incisa]